MTQRESGGKARKIIRWLIPLVISSAAIWLTLRHIELSIFIANLSQISILTFVLAIFVFFASYFFRVYCWYLLLKRRVSFRDVFFVMGTGYLLNNIFPLRLGEIGRAILLAEPEGPSTLEVLSSVMVERALDVFLAAGFILLLLPRIVADRMEPGMFRAALIAVFLILCTIYLLGKFQRQILRWLSRLGERIPVIVSWVLPKAKQLLEGLSVVNQPGIFITALGSLALSWLLAFGENYLIFNELHPSPPFWWMMFVLSAGAFGMALPSAPAGLGLFEGAMVAAFLLLTVDANTAFTHAVIIHMISFITMNIIGMIGLRLRGEAIFTFYQRLIHRSSERLASE